MKKLTPTQTRILNDLTNTLEVIRKYNDFADFFDHSENEQNHFATAFRCNSDYSSSEKYQTKDPETWRRMKEAFEAARNNSIISVLAKTETVNALEAAGKIQVIEHPRYKGGMETVKVL